MTDLHILTPEEQRAAQDDAYVCGRNDERKRIAAAIVAHCLADQFVEDGDEAKVCRYCYAAAQIALGGDES